MCHVLDEIWLSHHLCATGAQHARENPIKPRSLAPIMAPKRRALSPSPESEISRAAMDHLRTS
jgi:hypothetical protein